MVVWLRSRSGFVTHTNTDLMPQCMILLWLCWHCVSTTMFAVNTIFLIFRFFQPTVHLGLSITSIKHYYMPPPASENWCVLNVLNIVNFFLSICTRTKLIRENICLSIQCATLPINIIFICHVLCEVIDVTHHIWRLTYLGIKWDYMSSHFAAEPRILS